MTTHWPRTPVELDGRRYDLCLNLGAIAGAQVEFDHRGIEVNLLEAVPEFTLANVRVLWPYSLHKYHSAIDSKAAATLMTFRTVFPIAAALRAAWRAAAPSPGKENGRKAQSASPLTKEERWQRLWSLARYDLRLSDEDFQALTFGQLDSLMRRHERAIKEREFLFGQLASCTVNFSMGRPKEPVQAKDFMPSEWEQVAAEQPRRRRRIAIATEVRGVMANWLKNQPSHSAP